MNVKNITPLKELVYDRVEYFDTYESTLGSYNTLSLQLRSDSQFENGSSFLTSLMSITAITSCQPHEVPRKNHQLCNCFIFCLGWDTHVRSPAYDAGQHRGFSIFDL